MTNWGSGRVRPGTRGERPCMRCGMLRPGGERTLPMRRILGRLATYAAAIAVRCLPAIWNGFPLLFHDTGGYLERWPSGTLGNGRSAAYGLLVWLAAPTWWSAVVILQAAATVAVLACALRAVGLDRSPL